MPECTKACEEGNVEGKKGGRIIKIINSLWIRQLWI
jgi:hypothetical protein